MANTYVCCQAYIYFDLWFVIENRLFWLLLILPSYIQIPISLCMPTKVSTHRNNVRMQIEMYVTKAKDRINHKKNTDCMHSLLLNKQAPPESTPFLRQLTF